MILDVRWNSPPFRPLNTTFLTGEGPSLVEVRPWASLANRQIVGLTPPLMRMDVWALAGISLTTSVWLPTERVTNPPLNCLVEEFKLVGLLVLDVEAALEADTPGFREGLARDRCRWIHASTCVAGSGGGACHHEPSHHQRSRHGTPYGPRKFYFVGNSRRYFSAGSFPQVLLGQPRVNGCVLWNSLRSDQKAYAGLLPFVDVPWHLLCANVVMCSDASEARFGFATWLCDQQQVTFVGRILERTRFRSIDGAVRVRDRALSSSGVVLDEEDGDEDVSGSDEVLAFLNVSKRLTGAYTELNERSDAFRRQTRMQAFPPPRRSVSGRVMLRKMFACAFRTGRWLTFRSIPSEVNFADEGSRYFDPHCGASKFDARVTKCVTQDNQILSPTGRWAAGGGEEFSDKRCSTSDAPSVLQSGSVEQSQQSSPMVSAGHPLHCLLSDATSLQDSAITLSVLEIAVFHAFQSSETHTAGLQMKVFPLKDHRQSLRSWSPSLRHFSSFNQERRSCGRLHAEILCLF